MGLEGDRYETAVRILSALTVLISVAAPSIAGDVHFDPGTAVKGALVDQAANAAEQCIHGILLVSLYRGQRDRDILVGAAVAQCEANFKNRLAAIDPAFANKPGVRDLLVESGNRQLDEIIASGE